MAFEMKNMAYWKAKNKQTKTNNPAKFIGALTKIAGKVLGGGGSGNSGGDAAPEKKETFKFSD